MESLSYRKILDSTLYYRKKAGKTISGIILYTGIVFFSVFIFDLGFKQNPKEEAFLHIFYHSMKWVLITSFLLRNFLNLFNRDKPLKTKLLDLSILISLFLTFRFHIEGSYLNRLLYFLPSYKYLYTPILSFIFIIEYSRNAVSFYSRRINPYWIMVLSFIVIIILGAILLSLPNSSYTHISLTDTIFTSTTAVCVTGFSVINIATDLTLTGQIILLILIQIGGLGILTFASFLGFLFSGRKISFQQRLLLRELATSQRVNDVIHTVYKIVLIMLLVESLGAVLIFYSVPDGVFDTVSDQVFFAIFHSISAFCNSGLSNFPGGLHHVDLRFQSVLLLNISFLIILGGIGFPIMLNLYDYLKLWVKNIWKRIRHKKRFTHIPYVINLNSKIIFITTAILLAVGWFGFFVFEYNTALREYSFPEKLSVAFFTSATTRTAGFGVIDLSGINFPTYILTIVLMWIGASPGGTGGGVKTTTFAVMVMNFWSLAKGENRLIIQKRRISNVSINKSFAIIIASLLWIGLSIFLIILLDPQFSLEEVVFEAFSAFSTTGLTQGITTHLSDGSKFVLIFLMLIGRVGSIAFLSMFLYTRDYSGIRHPKQDIQL